MMSKITGVQKLSSLNAIKSHIGNKKNTADRPNIHYYYIIFKLLLLSTIETKRTLDHQSLWTGNINPIKNYYCKCCVFETKKNQSGLLRDRVWMNEPNLEEKKTSLKKKEKKNVF